MRPYERACIGAIIIALLALSAVPADGSDADAGGITVTVIPGEASAGWKFTFIATSGGSECTDVDWTLGDGGTYHSEGGRCEWVYKKSGIWTVTADAGGSEGLNHAVCADPAPISEVHAWSVYRYCPGLVSGVSAKVPGLSWDPAHMVLSGRPTAEGDYTVTVKDLGGAESSFTLKVGKSVIGADPTFSVTVDGGEISAIPHAAGTGGLSWLWNLSNGSGYSMSSSRESPIWTVDESGEYTVTCRVSNAAGSVVTEQTVTVSLPEAPAEDSGSEHDYGWLMSAGIVVAVIIILAAAARFL